MIASPGLFDETSLVHVSPRYGHGRGGRASYGMTSRSAETLTANGRGGRSVAGRDAQRGSIGALDGGEPLGDVRDLAADAASPMPAQSSRTGQTSHRPISIVTSRLSDRDLVGAVAERVEEQEHDQRRRAAGR